MFLIFFGAMILLYMDKIKRELTKEEMMTIGLIFVVCMLLISGFKHTIQFLEGARNHSNSI